MNRQTGHLQCSGLTTALPKYPPCLSVYMCVCVTDLDNTIYLALLQNEQAKNNNYIAAFKKPYNNYNNLMTITLTLLNIPL